MATKKGAQTQKWLLLKISKDDRLPPNKRLLATLLLGFIEGLYPFELIENTYGFGAAGKIRWADKDEPDSGEDKETKEAKSTIGALYRDLLGEENERDTTST